MELLSSNKDHARDLLLQKNPPKNFGLVNGFYSVEAYPGTNLNDENVTVKPVFCRVIGGKTCNPNHVPKTPSETIQAIVVDKDQISVRVIKNGNEVTKTSPILCANCPQANSIIRSKSSE